MNQRQALAAFAALSQETRLQIVRLLVVAAPEGMAAGALAEKVEVSPSNISFHLKELEHSGLIAAQRQSRSIIYTANYEALGGSHCSRREGRTRGVRRRGRMAPQQCHPRARPHAASFHC
jgi:DNA-binding transcriptional ArsR family regulator